MADEQQKKPEQKPAPPPAGEQKAAPPKPPARPAPPKPEPLDNELIRRLRARFSEAIGEATLDRKQAIVVVQPGRFLDVCDYLRTEEKFDFLTDLTAVDWYGREKRFDLILNLYSFSHNQRLRLKVPLGEDAHCPSVAGLWGTANWLERECFDMFGIVFDGHPDLRRILLPDGWKGHPLRKDYDILQQDVAWVKENLGIESGQ
jgi:NADH-quinone oxidoreductase subunit C